MKDLSTAISVDESNYEEKKETALPKPSRVDKGKGGGVWKFVKEVAAPGEKSPLLQSSRVERYN